MSESQPVHTKPGFTAATVRGKAESENGTPVPTRGALILPQAMPMNFREEISTWSDDILRQIIEEEGCSPEARQLSRDELRSRRMPPPPQPSVNDPRFHGTARFERPKPRR